MPHLINSRYIKESVPTTVDHLGITLPVASRLEHKPTPSSQGCDPNDRPQCFRNSFEECLYIFTVMMATACTTFLQGVTIINTATIGRDLRMDASQVEWISAAIGLGSGSSMLFFGKTADILGRKHQILFGMAFLALMSLITSFSSNPIIMDVLCGFLGLGTAMVSPPAIGTMFTTYPEGRRRNRAVGALGAANPTGFILGSISSGLTTKYWNWRASFYTVSIFFTLMTGLVFWTMPSNPPPENVRTYMKQFDYFGTLLIVGGVAFCSAALTEGPELGWNTPFLIFIFLLGASSFIGFDRWENIFPYPLLNPVVWKNRTFTLCVLSTMFGYMSFVTNHFWITLYMQQIRGFQPLYIAILLLPQAVIGILWSYLGQALTSRINGTLVMAIGGVAYVIGAVLPIFIDEQTSYWKILFPQLLITVIGADFQFIISNLYINTQMPEQSSLAAGVLQTAMRQSIAIGLAISAAAYGRPGIFYDEKNPNKAYQRAYICSIAFAVIGLSFVPFMKIGRHGEVMKCSDIEENNTSGKEILNTSR